VEGPTDDLDVVALREQQKRNFLATLFLSQGVPMLVAGDEMGRTQRGNNNAYCQDNEISWVDWSDVRENSFLYDFTSRLTRLRREHPIFHRRRYFQGRPIAGSGGLDDIVWLTPGGEVMDDEDWHAGWARSLGVFLNGEGIPDPDARGQRVTDDSFLLFFNAHYEPLNFRLPGEEYGSSWELAVDTAHPMAFEVDSDTSHKAEEEVRVEARSLVMLRRQF
jgi:glycogen operon protein